MSIILISVITLGGILLGKILFKKSFNHLSLYCLIMGGLVFFYELKLLPYPDIIPLAWFYLISAFLSFLFGIITIFSIRNLSDEDYTSITKTSISLSILNHNGKILKYLVIFFSSVGLFAAIQNWMVLINMFGSIPAVFLNAPKIYRMGIEGEIKGVIPYLFTFGYVAVFFSGIYTAYKGKFTFLTFYPFLGIIIREIAIVGRAGMLLGFMEFLFSFILFRHFLKSDIYNRYKFSKPNIIIYSVLLLSILIISASLVRITRTPAGEKYQGAAKELRDFRNNPVISPSIYLYVSSDIGVFSKYLEIDNEESKFGQNTFLPFYRFLSKFDFVEKPSDFQKGYHIPMWTNTGSYLRELHSDFGVAGIFLGSYLLGLLTTFFWFRFFKNQSMIAFVFLVYFYLIIGFSFLTMISRLSQWFISLTISIFILYLIDLMIKKQKLNQNPIQNI